MLPHARTVTSFPSCTTFALPRGMVYSVSGTSSFMSLYNLVGSRNTTGSGSLMADIKRPFALYGELGTTTFMPGMWQNNASDDSEWSSGGLMPMPYGVLTTIGH